MNPADSVELLDLGWKVARLKHQGFQSRWSMDLDLKAAIRSNQTASVV